MRMSTPPAMVMPMAWFVTVVAPTRPLTGAYTMPTWGTMPTPSPKNPLDIASSWISSSVTTVPVTGA